MPLSQSEKEGLNETANKLFYSLYYSFSKRPESLDFIMERLNILHKSKESSETQTILKSLKKSRNKTKLKWTHQYLPKIAFFYGKTNSGILARIEYIHDEHISKADLDHYWEMILAESVVGQGYPNPLLVAHKTATITQREEAKFFEYLQKFCLSQKIPFHISLKEYLKNL